MYKRIVAGTDLSPTAHVATRRASLLAKGMGAELFLVHVGTDPGVPLKELADTLGAEPVVASGNPAESLIAECERLDAGLLVVGSVGMSGAKRFLLGNVPNKVSHHASRDLLIVKTDPIPEDVDAYEKVLVGTDGSPTALRAVEMAAQLCNALGLTPTVVCSYEALSDEEMRKIKTAAQGDVLSQWATHSELGSVPNEFRWRIPGAAQAEDVLERAFDHAAKFGVEPVTRAVEGAPADTLIHIAKQENFDMLAVGSVGMSGAKRFMLGNVPHRISHHAPTDVLILHTA